MATPGAERRDDRAARPKHPPPTRPLAPGSSVADWLVVGVLREEPAHVLYAATLGQSGPPAALKLIDPSPVHDAGYFRYLRRAARRWQRAASPYLVRLSEVGKSPAGPYLATALFTGPALSAELEAGPLTPCWRPTSHPER